MLKEEPIIEICSGKIKGLKRKSDEDYEFYAFLGIPYAKPPIGKLRFRDPEPVESWSGIKDCKNFGPVCPQNIFNTNNPKQSEDCLYLNVYSKTLSSDAQQPVMFWIHGGGFSKGSGNDDITGPDYLLKFDVVFVTVNYRLNALGFLNLDDEVAPGNYGLKDQVLALQWVKDNITNFGGDPNNVTIFGVSAGAAFAHFLALSPLSKGLFQKVICQSGTANAPWASIQNPKVYGIRLAKILGYESEDPENIVDFLRTVECRKLVDAQKKVATLEERVMSIFCFGPTVDDKSRNPLLPHPIDEMVKQGIQKPSIFGYTDREGLFFLPNPKDSRRKLEDNVFGWFTIEYFDTLNKNFENHVHPKVIDTFKKYGMSASDLKQMYLGTENISKENENIYADMAGDIFIVGPTHEVAKIQVQGNFPPTFMYLFSYDKGFSYVKNEINTSLPGACHADELRYLFKSKFYEAQCVKNEADRNVMEEMVELWTNFAKFGRPELSKRKFFVWKQLANSGRLDVLNIGENLRMESLPYFEEKFL